MSSDTDRRQPGDDAASLLPSAGVVDDQPTTDIDDHRHSWVRDHQNVGQA